MGVHLLRSKLQNKKLRSVKTIRSGLSKQREIKNELGHPVHEVLFSQMLVEAICLSYHSGNDSGSKNETNTLFVNSIDQNSVEFVDPVER